MRWHSIFDLVRLSTGREMNTVLLDNDKEEKKGIGKKEENR